MGWFRRKKDKFVDLGKRYEIQERKASEISSVAKSKDNTSNLGFLGGLASSSDSNSLSSTDYAELSNHTGDKKKKLAKRLMDMTKKIEDLSNQIYHLQQRIEVLERKSGV